MSQVIHPYDYVRIKVPKFFVRCGYPLQYDQEVHRIYKEHAKDIIEFMDKLGIIIPEYNSGDYIPRTPYRIAKAVAYDLLCQKKFGGYERTIYTVELPEYKDQDFHVQAVKFVKTGTYEPACVAHDYYGEREYEAAYLANAKTHRIIETPLYYDQPNGHHLKKLRRGDTLQIEADNLEILATPVIQHKKRRKCSAMSSK